MRDGKTTALTAFSVLTIAYWLSRTVFPFPLPPLAPMPDLSAIHREIRPDVLRRFITEWLLIGTGIVSGLLLLLRRSAGRWLALGLCGWLLGWEIVYRASGIAQHGWSEGLRVWQQAAQTNPRGLTGRLVEAAFCVMTLAWLGPLGAGHQPWRPASPVPRWVRTLLIITAPPVVLSLHRGLEAAVLAHFGALLLSLAALGMSVRLRWAPATVMLPARFLAWANVAAAWGVVWSLVLLRLSGTRSLEYSIIGAIGALISSTALGSSLVLFWMLRRAASRARPSKPWTTFA